jgi:hypothetical protein
MLDVWKLSEEIHRREQIEDSVIPVKFISCSRDANDRMMASFTWAGIRVEAWDDQDIMLDDQEGNFVQLMIDNLFELAQVIRGYTIQDSAS